jgi:hypothetical protein
MTAKDWIKQHGTVPAFRGELRAFALSTQPRIVVRLDGGLIQDIWSNVPVEVLQLDTDLDGIEPENLIKYPLDWDPKKVSSATAWLCRTEDESDPHGMVSPGYVAKVFKSVLNQMRKACGSDQQ